MRASISSLTATNSCGTLGRSLPPSVLVLVYSPGLVSAALLDPVLGRIAVEQGHRRCGHLMRWRAISTHSPKRTSVGKRRLLTKGLLIRKMTRGELGRSPVRKVTSTVWVWTRLSKSATCTPSHPTRHGLTSLLRLQSCASVVSSVWRYTGKPSAHGVLTGPFTPGKNFGEDASLESCLGDEATSKAELTTPVTPVYLAMSFFQILMHFPP